MTDLEIKYRERMTDLEIKRREKLLKLRANVDKIPYKDIPGINYDGDKWHVEDGLYIRATKRMVVHMFRLISEKNYDGIKDMFTALNPNAQSAMNWYGQPIEKNTDEFYNSTYQTLNHGRLGTAKRMSFWDKEQIISLLKKKYSIFDNITTPAEFAASLLLKLSTESPETSPEDIVDLWSILFLLSEDDITKTDYMQDFIRKAENIKSFDDDAKEAAKTYKKKYFKERMSEKFSSMKGNVGSFFGKKTEAPTATQAAARAAEPVARAPVWWGGVRRKSRKQNKSRKQGKTKKQRKNRK